MLRCHLPLLMRLAQLIHHRYDDFWLLQIDHRQIDGRHEVDGVGFELVALG